MNVVMDFAIKIKNGTSNIKVLTILPGTYRIIESIYVVFAIYIFVSFAFFLLRPYLTMFKICREPPKMSAQRAPDEPSTTSYEDKMSNCRKTGSLHRHRYQMYARVAMTSLTVLMSSMVLIHVTMDLWAYSDNNTTSAYVQCVRHIVSGLFYIISAFCLYGFLWIRQRAFYAHPVLKHLAKPCLIRFSWSVLATIIFAVFSITVLFFLPQIQKIHRMYSLDNSTITLDSYEIDYAAYGIVPLECGFQRKDVYLGLHLAVTMGFLYFQISLQILFAYPIFKQRQKQDRLHKTPSSNLSLRDDCSSNYSFGRSRKSGSTYDTTVEGEESVVVRLSSGSGLGLPTDDKCESSVFDDDATSGLSMKICRFEEGDDISQQTRHSFSVQVSSSDNNGNILNKSDTCGDKLKCEILKVEDECGMESHRANLNVRNDENRDSTFRDRPQNACSNEVTSNSSKRHLSITQAKNSTSKSVRKISAKFGSVRFKELRRRTTVRTLMERRNRRARAHLRAYVVRCLCVSIICSVSDVIAFLISFFAQFHYHEELANIHSGVTESLVTSLAYNANVIVNLLCMLACYKDWRARICPWYYLYKDMKIILSS
ncbi:uncharacterized protein LOC120347464 [Styela clava]